MSQTRVQFDGMEWEPLGEFAHQKLADNDGHAVRLLKLLPGFIEQDWCERGHIGFVVEVR